MRKGFKYRIKKISPAFLGMVFCQQLAAQQPRPIPANYSNNINISFVRTWNAKAPELNPNTLMARPLKDVVQTTQFIDGLGRPLQTVVKQGSMATGYAATDLVSPVEYDQFDREPYKYLPYAEPSANDGNFKLNPFAQQAAFYNATSSSSPLYNQNETFFYSKSNFDGSPLNKVTDMYAPGNSWVGSEGNTDATTRRNVQVKQTSNTPSDEVHIFSVTDNGTGFFGTYAYAVSGNTLYTAGQLNKTISIDEHKRQVIEFKDKNGNIILKKVQLSTVAGVEDDGAGRNYNGWLCTYYIYDDIGNLRCVIQPEGVKALVGSGWAGNGLLTPTILNEQCFRYEYDQRNRIIMKKVPGAGEVYMVYDNRDRAVMMQDANMRQGTVKWMVTKYDDLNRPIETGLWNNNTAFTTHLSLAYNNSDYPGSISNYEPLTFTHYDDYVGLPASLSATYLTAWNSNFSATNNLTWPYPQMPVQSNAVKGMPTWTQVKVLGSSNTYLNSVTIYDEKGRPIQLQSTNITGGVDVVTTQYTWAGQPLVTVQKQDKQGTPVQTHTVITKMQYDDLGRLLNVKKTVNSTINSIAINKAEQLIVQNEYNQLGQLKKKTLGANNLENINYEYNIRGWMLGANRDYAKDATTNNYFGFDLGYDKANNNIIGSQAYTNPQYNGNIEGIVWKSKGDGEKRKYDFGYDAANRLMKADFTQYTGGSFNQSAGVNYDVKMGDGNPVNNNAYDANGNILSMQQWGWKVTGSTQIDNMRYTYISQSNKLKSVTDFNNDPITKLGDFKTNTTHPQNSTKSALTINSTQAQFDAITDYDYDTNGNLTLDNNKTISSITYNYLNLPVVITVNGKGTITYTYNAGGNKIKKQTTDISTAGKTVSTTTTYIAGMVYETKTTSPANTPNDDYVDRLQFIGHEEGRIRFKPAVDNIAASFQYDYMLKDHLGNVRMVLTEEQQVDLYPAATMETAAATTEEQLYANLPATRTDKSTIAGYPTDSTTSPNDKVAKTNGNGNKIGPAIVLKVMAGDKFNVKVSSWYRTNGATPNTPVNPLPDLLAALINGVSGVSASGGHGVTTTELQSSGVLTPGATGFLNNQTNNSNNSKPRAYINWILFDEQFKFVSSSSGFEQVGNNEEFKLHVKNDMPIEKSGYLYVYVSNNTPNIDVFFDNLQVTHTRGSILEETHYYPFGLIQQGISSKAAGGLENKKKFNGGSELQSKEFSDGSGLEMYDTHFRQLDPQLGRWWQLDPKPNTSESPYAAMGNNPILFNDILGDTLDFPDATSEFKAQFNEAYSHLKKNGVGGMITEIKNFKKGTVKVVKTDNPISTYDPETNTLSWNPVGGTWFDNETDKSEFAMQNSMSPAAVLNHEMDHALADLKDPKAFEKRSNTPDAKYKDKEERRVITGSEQKTAKALKEITVGKVTRTNHKGHAQTTASPTSNKTQYEIGAEKKTQKKN